MYSLARTRLRRWGGTWETGGTKYNIIAVYGIRGAGKTYTGLQHYVSVLNAALLGSADYNRLSYQ